MNTVKKLLLSGLLLFAICANNFIGCANGPAVEVCIVGTKAMECSYEKKEYTRSFLQTINYLCVSPKDYGKLIEACQKGGAPEVEVCVSDSKNLICENRDYTLAQAINFVCMSDIYLGRLLKYCAK